MYNVYTFVYLCTDMYSRCRVQPGACNTHVYRVLHMALHMYFGGC